MHLGPRILKVEGIFMVTPSASSFLACIFPSFSLFYKKEGAVIRKEGD
jgi:hypothetical protein